MNFTNKRNCPNIKRREGFVNSTRLNLITEIEPLNSLDIGQILTKIERGEVFVNLNRLESQLSEQILSIAKFSEVYVNSVKLSRLY